MASERTVATSDYRTIEPRAQCHSVVVVSISVSIWMNDDDLALVLEHIEQPIRSHDMVIRFRCLVRPHSRLTVLFLSNGNDIVLVCPPSFLFTDRRPASRLCSLSLTLFYRR